MIKNLTKMSDEELIAFVKEEKLKGTTLENLLDLVNEQETDWVLEEINLRNFVSYIYKFKS